MSDPVLLPLGVFAFDPKTASPPTTAATASGAAPSNVRSRRCKHEVLDEARALELSFDLLGALILMTAARRVSLADCVG